jgi:hypothetical protein
MATLPALYPQTKFQPPPARAEHVLRDRCFELVDDVMVVIDDLHAITSAEASPAWRGC